jgi:hypothetical protein
VLRVVIIAAVVLGAGLIVWKVTAPASEDAARTEAAAEASPQGRVSALAEPPAPNGEMDRAPGTAARQGRQERPSLAAELSAPLATIDATPEEIEVIFAAEADYAEEFAQIPDDVRDDERVNAVLEAAERKRDKLVELLGERRADLYRKARAEELQPEMDELLGTPSDTGPVAPSEP